MRRLIQLLAVLATVLGTASVFSACVVKTECVRGAVEVGGECVCPAGTTRVTAGGLDSCISDDGGLRDASPDDAGDAGPPDAPPADAGPCGMACPTATPVCDTTTGTCVACVVADDCAATPSTPACDPDAHTCVACNVAADCTDLAAPECSAAHACVPCTSVDACSARVGTTVCDTAGAGACAECSAADRTACGGNVCDSTLHTCTTVPAGMTGLCQTCVSDAQCRTGQLCVPMTFDTPARAVGNFCLWRQDATGTGAPAGSCFSVRPYVRAATDVTSLDGTVATVCGLATTTCPALNAFRTVNCMTLDPAGDARCGASGFADGLCRMFDAAANRCTVECGSDDDCPTTTTCDTSVTPRVCLF